MTDQKRDTYQHLLPLIPRVPCIHITARGLDVWIQGATIHTGPFKEKTARTFPNFHYYYLSTGHGAIRHGKHTTPLAPGSVVLLYPENAHSLTLTDEAICWEVSLTITGGKLPLFIGCLTDEGTTTGICHKTTSDAIIFLDAIQSITSRRMPRPWIDRICISSLFSWFCLTLGAFIDLKKSWFQFAINKQNKAARLCHIAMSYMREHMAEAFTLTDIANQLQCTPRHLNRLFQQEMQTTVHQALLNMRLEESQRLLQLYPDWPVKRVAFACGFRSAAYFCRAFRAHVGNTPQAFRNTRP